MGRAVIIHVIVEDFAGRKKTHEPDDVIAGLKLAQEMSLRHDTDYVLIFMNGAPVGKYIDGESVKL